jgi:hypothetical protein
MNYRIRAPQHQKFYLIALEAIETYYHKYVNKSEGDLLGTYAHEIAHEVSLAASKNQEVKYFSDQDANIIFMQTFIRLAEFSTPIPSFAAQLAFDDELISHLVEIVHESDLWKAGGRIDPMHL